MEGAYPNCLPSKCGGDRHVLVIDNATCRLYEMYNSVYNAMAGVWRADSGAVFNLTSNK